MTFSFVSYDGPERALDPSVRKLIRRQAMKDTATEWKRKGESKQRNLGQFPVFLQESDHTKDLSNSPRKKCLSKIKLPAVPCQHKSASSSPVSIPRSPSDLSLPERFYLLLHLAPLTGLRLGIAPGGSKNIFTTPHLGSRKVLSFIPSRYGHVLALSHATDLVVAKLQQIVESGGEYGEARVLVYYTKALRSLQTALDDDIQRTTAETLCATELLGIFELLNGTPGTRPWMRHASGASQLMQARGTHKFRTEFEMALFTAQVGPTVMDAILNNKSCFLEEESWKKVMYSAIRSDEFFTERSDLVLALWGHLVDGPKKFKQVTDLIALPTPPPLQVINDLIEQILNDRKGLISWEAYAQSQPNFPSGEFETHKNGTIFSWPKSTGGKCTPQQITQLALWGTYVLCRILKARLLVALSPSRFHSLEAECQDLAGRIMGLAGNLAVDEGEQLLDNVFISQSTWIAKGIVETEDIWCERGEMNEEGIIEKWKFDAWCNAIGRTTGTSTIAS